MTTYPNKTLRWVLTFSFLMLAHTTAYAQATRTWVSGVGDDANPCSRTAPCKTFAGAISKTSAGGEINTLDPGGFGGVTITKAITIQSDESKNGGVLVSGTNGIIVAAGASDVVSIRGLVIDGFGTGLNGIKFLSGAALHVENCHIRQFNGAGGYGILFAPSTGISRLYVSDSSINDNGDGATGGGIGVVPTSTGIALGTIDSTHVSNNKGFGIRVADNGYMTIQNTHVDGSEKSGVAVVSVTNASDVVLTDSVVAEDGWAATVSDGGVLASGSQAYLHLSNNLITNNEQGIRILSSGKVYTFGNNKVDSNTVNGTVTATKTQL